MTSGGNAGIVVEIGDPPLFKSLGRKKAYEEVTEAIRRQIFAQRMPPLHRLPTERELAEQFGVSRSAVREAIRALERTGLVTVRKGPRGGIFVAHDYDRPINDSIANLLAGGGASLDDLFEMRALIEPYAAARAAELASEDELDQLAALVGQAEMDRRHGASIRAANIDFHRLILRMSKNPVLSVMGEVVLRVLSDRITDVVSPDTSDRALSMHKSIVEAIRKRQPNKAKLLMASDIGTTGEMLAQMSPEARVSLATDEVAIAS